MGLSQASPQTSSETTAVSGTEMDTGVATSNSDTASAMDESSGSSTSGGGASGSFDFAEVVRGAMPELYEMIKDVLTYENVHPHIEAAVDQGITGLSALATDTLNGLDGTEVAGVAVTVDDGAAAALVGELAPLLEAGIDSFLAAHEAEIIEKLAGWVDAHPRSTVAIAVAAGLGYAFFQLTTDELGFSIPVGSGTTIDLAGSLGILQNKVNDMARVTISNEADNLMLAIQVENSDGTTTVSAEGEAGNFNFEANSEFTSDGLQMLGADVGYTNGDLSAGAGVEHTPEQTITTATVDWQDGTTETGVTVQHNTETGDLTLTSGVATQLSEETEVHAATVAGAEEGGLSGGMSTDVTSDLSATADLAVTNTYDASSSLLAETGFEYSRTDLDGLLNTINAEVSGSVQTGDTPSQSVSASGSMSTDNGVTVDGSASYSNNDGQEESSVHAGVEWEGTELEGPVDSASGSVSTDYTNVNGEVTQTGTVAGEVATHSGHSAGASLTADQRNPQVLQAGAFYQFTSEDEFTQVLTEYAYDVEKEYEHEWNVTAAHQFDGQAVRFFEVQSSLMAGSAGYEGTTGATVGFDSGSDYLTPVVGTSATYGTSGNSLTAGGGVQLGDQVRVMGTITAGAEGVTPGLQITIPLSAR